MTEKLDPEVKRLRKLAAGVLADEIGGIKAQIADLEAKLETYKAEAVRRDLREAEGALFRIALTPSTTQLRIEAKFLRQVFGDAFVDHFSRAVDIGWVLRCSARKAA
jgi:chromosomal replication initiation ATPase DnaA